jgi:hypothetical protein
MLGIPTNADPTRHLRGHSPPPRPGTKTKHQTAVSHSTQKRAISPRRRGKSPINAIVVDDEEVDEMDSEDSDEIKHIDYSDGEEEMDMDDGVEEITIPNGNGITGIRDRFQSVSEDEFEVPRERDILDTDNVDSRYTLGSKSKSSTSGILTPNIQAEVDDEDLDELRSTDSDESIIAIEKPSNQPPNRAGNRGKGGRGIVGSGRSTQEETRSPKKGRQVEGRSGAGVKARKDFWAAKGLNGVGGGDEFEDGTDYVGLD